MGNPLRVLHVVVNMNRGGAETLIMNLYRNIDRKKVQFDFLTSKEGVFDKEIIQMGGNIYRIPYISDIGFFNYVKALNDFFKRHNDYQIVHSHMDKMSGFVLRSARKAGIPMRISHSHNTRSEGSFAIKSFKWFAGLQIMPNATHLMACSKKASQWLFGNQSEKAAILKNGIDIEIFKHSHENRCRIRRELNLSNDCLTIGHVGRFCAQKNHTFLIDILNEIIRLHDNSKLVLVGDGPLRYEIEKKAKEKGLDKKVIFLGIRSDVPDLMNAFDVIAFPSLHEGLPVTLIEAQGAGIPCVISNEITDEVDLGTGLIRFEGIKSPAQIWAHKIIKAKRMFKDTVKSITENGFDITQSAKWLQDFYLKKSTNYEKDKETA